MVRRIDRIKDIQGQAIRRGRTSAWPHRIFAPVSPAGSRAVGVRSQDSTSKVSLACKLERDTRLTGRAANWLFIKGGIVILLFLGLIVLGLIGVFQGGR